MTTVLNPKEPRHSCIQHTAEVFKLMIIHSQAFIIPFGVVAPSQFHVIPVLEGLWVCFVLPLSVPRSGNFSSKELFPCLGGQYVPLPSVPMFIRLGIPSPDSCNNTRINLWEHPHLCPSLWVGSEKLRAVRSEEEKVLFRPLFV